jgi:hypothetical protein
MASYRQPPRRGPLQKQTDEEEDEDKRGGAARGLQPQTPTGAVVLLKLAIWELTKDPACLSQLKFASFQDAEGVKDIIGEGTKAFYNYASALPCGKHGAPI